MNTSFFFIYGWLACLLFPGRFPQAGDPDFSRQPIFENGTSGYACYRIPAIIRAPNGELLAFAEGRTNSCDDYGDVDIVLRRSNDNGRSWAPLHIIVDNDKRQAGNPTPVVDRLDPVFPGGRIFLFYNTGNNHEGENRKGNGLREVWYITSTDNGQHWSAPVNITSSVHRPRQPEINAAYNFAEDWRSYANAPGHALQLRRGTHAGRLLVPANHSAGSPQDHFNEYLAHTFFSDDHGHSWQLGTSVDLPSSNESIAAELPDGRVILNSRQQNGESRRRIVSISSDGGRTWDSTFLHPQLISPVCQASLLEYRPGTGKPVLLFSNPASTDRRERMTVRVSYDGGRTWTASRLVDPGPSAYSDLVQQADNRIGLLYEKGNNGGIHYAHFSYDWLLAVPRTVGRYAPSSLFGLAAPDLEYAGAFFSDSLTIRASLDMPGSRLHYTLDGSTPTDASPEYLGPVTIKESALVQVRAFHDQLQPSEAVKATFFRTPPPLPVREATLRESPSPKYPGSGVNGLLDHRKGPQQFSSPEWMGFEGNDLVLTIEWAQVQAYRAITVSSLHAPGSWILQPAALAAYSSRDGEHFELLAESPIDDLETTPGFVFPDLSFPPTSSRFLRVVVKNAGVLPPDHPGAGNPAWLFVDEILIH